MLREHSISHQIILSKVDRVLFKNSSPSVIRIDRNSPQLDTIVENMKPLIQPGKGDGPEALGEIITCSAVKRIEGTKVGINNLRWAVLAATGFLQSGADLKTARPSNGGFYEESATSRHSLRADGQLSAVVKL